MKRLIFWLIPLVVIGLIVALLLPALGRARAYSGPGQKGICEVQMSRIARGMEEYKTDFGHYPNSASSEIFDALNGKNPKHKVYVEYIGYHAAPKWIGSFTDPWRSPYEIEIQGLTNVIIHSAGRNRRFGDGDDLIFNGSTESLANP